MHLSESEWKQELDRAITLKNHAKCGRLLTEGRSLDAPLDGKHTPLMLSILLQDWKLSNKLLQMGADPKVCIQGITALDIFSSFLKKIERIKSIKRFDSEVQLKAISKEDVQSLPERARPKLR